MMTKSIENHNRAKTDDYMNGLEEAYSSGERDKIENALHTKPDDDFIRGLQEAYEWMEEYQDIERARMVVQRIACIPKNCELSIAYLTREWVLSTSGWWRLEQLYRYLSLRERSDKQAALAEVLRLKRKGVVAKHRTENEKYRLVDRHVEELNIRIGSREGIEVYLPFGLHDMVKLFYGNIILITGQKDAGKTAICLEIAKQNRDTWKKINYITSEMGEDELVERLEKHEDMTIDEWDKIRWIARSIDIADIIEPDALNIVDFLQLSQGQTYEIGDKLEEIHDRLGHSGLAVVACQLDPGKDVARGGPSSLDKPRLYLAVKKGGTIKVVSAKNRKSPFSFTGQIHHFNIIKGAKIIPQGVWHNESECTKISCPKFFKNK